MRSYAHDYIMISLRMSRPLALFWLVSELTSHPYVTYRPCFMTQYVDNATHASTKSHNRAHLSYELPLVHMTSIVLVEAFRMKIDAKSTCVPGFDNFHLKNAPTHLRTQVS